MQPYRGYFKDILRITDKPKSFVIVREFKIRRDLITTANSTFKVLQVPNNVDNGDVFSLYSPKGEIIYTGIVNKIQDGEIQCKQIQNIFNGQWVYETSEKPTLEEEVVEIMKRYTKGYINESTNDPLMIQKYGQMEIEYTKDNKNHLQSKDNQTTENFENFIYELYQKYNIVVDVNIPYEGKPIITVKTPKETGYKVSNNNNSIVDITPVTEVAETNKLVVYSTEGKYRGSYFATSEGITQNASDPLRLKTINTNIQFSDDAIEKVIASNLPSSLYNHKLEFNMVIKSNLYDWYQWILGQPLEIYKNNAYFKTVYTGYELEMKDNFEPKIVKIICGKVRTKLTKKLTIKGN